MTRTTVLPLAERRGKRASECNDLNELKAWLGPRWKLVKPETAIEDMKKAGGFIQVELA